MTEVARGSEYGPAFPLDLLQKSENTLKSSASISVYLFDICGFSIEPVTSARGLFFYRTGISEIYLVFPRYFYFKPSQAIMESTHLKVRYLPKRYYASQRRKY
jgi:hypothetical protein